MPQDAIKLLGLLGGGAVIFYTVGFVTVQSFLHRNGYEGMFWLTTEFYRDAGAKFLLELVRAPLMAWYFFFPYMAVLYLWLVPAPGNLLGPVEMGPVWRNRNLLRCLGLVAVIAVTYIFALTYDTLLVNKSFANLVDTVFFDPTGERAQQYKQSLAFFSTVTPLILVVAVFLHRFRDALKSHLWDRGAYQLVALSFVVFLAIVPIAYGMHLYDWRTVAVKDPRALGGRYSDPSQAPARMWMVGEFGGRYVFLREDRSSTRKVFDSVASKDITHLNLDLRDSASLKYLLSDHKAEVAQQGRDFILEELTGSGK
jgi:hypothetical protein